ncbi:MAG: hypothetical protein F4Z80_04910 [Chloroflexi bacterium]|nr:hypothetical protein [Chloroflexota bacterium]
MAHSRHGGMEAFMEPDTGPAHAILDPLIEGLIRTLPVCQFSTRRFIAVFIADPERAEAYKAALKTLGDDPDLGLMALHGQVISVALRNDRRLKFAGFVREDDPEHVDPFCHSSWWRKEE